MVMVVVFLATQVHNPNGISIIGSAVFAGLTIDRQADRPRYSVG